MDEKKTRLVTAEAVRRGHPDKFCDQIADAILDAHLKRDPKSRVALEVMATAGCIAIGGEVTSRARVDYKQVVGDVIRDIGYQWQDLCKEDDSGLDIVINVHDQSTDIAFAVDGRYPDSDIGAGDQGIMFGYATNETRDKMPRAFILAQRICRLLDEEARINPALGADGKAQVSLKYEGEKGYVHTIVVSVQHSRNADMSKLRERIAEIVHYAVGRADMWEPTSKLLINPSGRFVLGGPAADTGLTGRKLAVDQYGPSAHIGGGAFSGKDGSKVDRSAAYAARWIAKNLVAAGMCAQCEVQLVYAIGICHPIGVVVNSFGTGRFKDEKLARLVARVFDLRPAAIIERLDLTSPNYHALSVYGHFGRVDLDLPWEKEDMVERLKAEALLTI